MSDVTIRPFELHDRESVLRLAADTAFFGEPVEAYLDDRRLFCDGLYRYYTDLEPQHGWVACASGAVVGFLMGCVDTAAQRRLWMQKIFPILAAGVLRGRYEIGMRTWRHLLALARAALYASPRVDLKRYPAHLHLNVHADWRGQGIGRQLLEAYLNQLHDLAIPGVHLNTTTLNSAANRLYEQVGFRLLQTRPAHQWSQLVPGQIFNVSYGLELR
jgi:GNAT superfamily N-acetyltransferase